MDRIINLEKLIAEKDAIIANLENKMKVIEEQAGAELCQAQYCLG